MTDYNIFQVGGVLYPLAAPGAQSTLQIADPALYYALDFWTYVIRTYCGTAITTAFSNAGLTVPSSAVVQAYPYEPLPEYLENQIQFPALFAYRKTARTEWHSVGFEQDVIALEVVYVLPTLKAAEAEIILPVLPAIAKALRRKTTDGWDPGYTPPGGSLGDQPWAAAYANVSEIGFGEYTGRERSVQRLGEFGYLEGVGNLYFPTVTLSAYVVERDMYNPTSGGPSKFVGADITGNVKTADGTKVIATASTLSQASTQGAPTVASLSVTTGSAAGGTSTVLTGTLFLPGAVVFFGPAASPTYAPSVTWNSSTSITVTTPAALGAGAVDVTVLNPDGQSGTLPASFTYT